MPYKNEHACRLKNPKDFERFARKNCEIKHDGKCIDVIYGIREDGKSEIQAFRYPVEEWTSEEAKNHCILNDGTFEEAIKEEEEEKEKEKEKEEVFNNKFLAEMSELFGPLGEKAVKKILMGEKRVAYFPISRFEWRQSGSGDGSRILTGYAAVYNQVTTLYKGESFTLREKIAPGAFDKVLTRNPDVHLMAFEHLPSGVPIARTTVKSGWGSLQLTSDEHGLRVYARLNPNDPDVQRLAIKMDNGLIDQMSYSFRAGKDKIETEQLPDGHIIETRTILEIDELYDVTVLAQGAYPQTEAILRSLKGCEISGACANRKVAEADDGASKSLVTEADDGASKSLVAHQRLALLARARIAKLKHLKEEKNG